MTQIRDARPADAAAIAALGRAAFVPQYEGLVDPANYTWAVSLWYSDEAVEQSIRRCERECHRALRRRRARRHDPRLPAL